MWVQCSKCKRYLALYCFDKAKDRLFSIRKECKDCRRNYKKNYVKKYRSNLSEEQKQKVKIYGNKYNKEYYQNHKVEWVILRKRYIDKLKSTEEGLLKLKESNIKKRKKYYQSHPEVFYEANQRRRALEEQAEGSHTYMEYIELFVKYDKKCLCCGKIVKRPHELTADHIIPLVKGGSNNIENIQPLCKICNSKKGVKIIDYRNNKE
jgi:5-methylcytosine-specific restriction endonuclease McrA